MSRTIPSTYKEYSTFSGCDVKAVFHNQVVGNLQAISYSCQREIAPIYTMGSENMRAVAKGKRGIAGAIIAITFDINGLLRLAANGTKEEWGHYKWNDVPNPVDANGGYGKSTGNAPAVNFNVETGMSSAEGLIRTVNDPNDVLDEVTLRYPQYVDQLPPFTIMLAAVNEVGSKAKMHIYGVHLMNEASGTSIDDTTTEIQTTYLATGIYPWTPISSDVIRGVSP